MSTGGLGNSFFSCIASCTSYTLSSLAPKVFFSSTCAYRPHLLTFHSLEVSSRLHRGHLIFSIPFSSATQHVVLTHAARVGNEREWDQLCPFHRSGRFLRILALRLYFSKISFSLGRVHGLGLWASLRACWQRNFSTSCSNVLSLLISSGKGLDFAFSALCEGEENGVQPLLYMEWMGVVFSGCDALLTRYELYRRRERGKVVS